MILNYVLGQATPWKPECQEFERLCSWKNWRATAEISEKKTMLSCVYLRATLATRDILLISHEILIVFVIIFYVEKQGLFPKIPSLRSTRVILNHFATPGFSVNLLAKLKSLCEPIFGPFVLLIYKRHVMFLLGYFAGWTLLLIQVVIQKHLKYRENFEYVLFERNFKIFFPGTKQCVNSEIAKQKHITN